MKAFIFRKLMLFPFIVYPIIAQTQCLSTVIIKLENNKGGFFSGQKVTFTSRANGKTFSVVSNDFGEAKAELSCLEIFDVKINNYTKNVEIEAPAAGRVSHTLSYSHDMVQKQKTLAMNETEKASVDKFFLNLPDTTFLSTSVMAPPKLSPEYYAMTILLIKDLKNKPLLNEVVIITGRKRQKTFKGKTDNVGRLLVYLPKGDVYDIHFKYSPHYNYTDCDYTKGSTDIKLTFSYMGTVEYLRRKKEEEERIALEEKRIKEERERFEKDCAARGLTLEECHRLEAERYITGEASVDDTVIYEVFRRQDWSDKLIVCDVTGSMSPYTAQVSLWYRLNYLKDKNMQFVLFNDGDNLEDAKKVIGKTGGIYYSTSKGIDSLDNFMGYVQAKGYGGDCPENNIEALLKAVTVAKPFKHLVMIADNDAPVKDIALLSSLKTPVHIIMCGVAGGRVHPDYLKIAWKTKGTIHTMEEDILNLARLSEGQQIKIGNTTYKIMGGEFVYLN